MIKITSPISILEFASSHIRLAIYEDNMFSNQIFFEEKIDFTRQEKYFEDQIISNLITKAEKNLGQHLNEINIMIDSPSIYSLDFCVQKNYEKKNVTNNDIDYLINESENYIKINNKNKIIIHKIKSNIYFDGEIINYTENISQKVSNLNLEIKFILIDKNVYNKIRDLFLKKHITLNKILCTSYIKCLGLINKLGISGYNSFIDIGLKKSSLTIFQDHTLLYLHNTHIGGDHITKDISKILNIDYRVAESKKLKFYKNSRQENKLNEDEFLKKIINSRLEEIIEILFLNCLHVKKNSFNSNLNLFFLGNGSKVLNENLLSFGPELNFIKEMSIIDENNFDCCNSAAEFIAKNKETETQKPLISIENKGFFEKLFGYFSKN